MSLNAESSRRLSSVLVVRRSLAHRWRSAAALAGAFAVVVAVLVGAMIVGDSMRASLAGLLLSRLGATELAVTPPRLFPADLSMRLAQQLPGRTVAAVLDVPASVRLHEDAPAIPGFSLLGVDAQFGQLFGPSGMPRLEGNRVAVGRSLAARLGLKVGDELILFIPRSQAAGEAALFAQKRTDRLMRPLRVEVGTVLPDTGAAAFSLRQGQDAPQNLFIDRLALAAAIGPADVANTLLIGGGSGDLPAILRRTLTATDLGLQVAAGEDAAYVHSTGLLLDDRMVDAIVAQAKALGAVSRPTSVYLATAVNDVTRSTSSAYAMMASQGEGDPPPGQVDINEYLAADLSALPGDAVHLQYLLPQSDGGYSTRGIDLTVRKIVRVSHCPRQIVPELAGISDAVRMDRWDAPFPVDLSRVTARDEAYWDAYRATPKLFVSADTMQQIWKLASLGDGRWVTGVSIQSPVLAEVTADLSHRLPQALPAEESGFVLRPVRDQAMAASKGSADFSTLFASMSLFIVISAGAMVATLVRLAVQQRGSELGLMLASGISRTRTMALLAMELTASLIVGLGLGLLLAVGYARLVLDLLASGRGMPWSVPDLRIELSVSTMAFAGGSCLAGGVLCSLLAMRGVARQSASWLLAGLVGPARGRDSLPRFAAAAGLLSFAGAAVCLTLPRWKVMLPTEAFFPAGALLLMAAMATFRVVLFRWGHAAGVSLTPMRLVTTNLGTRPLRSLLTVGLFASASFILISVALYRPTAATLDLADRSSPSGGYSLKVTTVISPGYDLASAAGRRRLGFTAEDELFWRDVLVQSLLQAGEGDISCLNLAKPQGARILGVDERFIARGGFVVHTPGPAQDPWRVLTIADPDGTIPIFGDAESMQWILKRNLGEVFELPRPGAAPLRVRLAGVVEGGLFAGEVIMSRECFARAFPQVARASVFLLQVPAGEREAVQHSLLERLGDFGVAVEPVETILDRVLSVRRLYISIFLLLGGLGLALGSAGQVAILLRQAYERRGEFAVLLAQGFSRVRVGLLLASEQAALLLAGLLIGSGSAIIAALLVLAHPALASMAAAMSLVGLLGCLATLAAIPLAVPRDALRTLRHE